MLKDIVKEYTVELVFIVLIIVALLWSEVIIGFLPHLPVESVSDSMIDWLNENWDPLFVAIAGLIKLVLNPITGFFTNLSPLVMIVLLAYAGYKLGGGRMASFIVAALLVVASMGFWAQAMITMSLVVTAALFALIIGVPLGVMKFHFSKFAMVLDPVLDFMQTMPLFVYLIPAVLFFSIGNVPGIVATFIFATPPAVRLTALGFEQIPHELLEVGSAFGASRRQKLIKVELPLALPSILMGMNQTIMLSLSMVVVASMIGAEGLGQEVLRGITRLKVGQGIAGGLGVVLLAMILDRLTRQIWTKSP